MNDDKNNKTDLICSKVFFDKVSIAEQKIFPYFTVIKYSTFFNKNRIKKILFQLKWKKLFKESNYDKVLKKVGPRNSKRFINHKGYDQESVFFMNN